MEDKHQISRAGIDEFRQHCQLQASTWKDDWNEREFTQFIDKVILKESLLSAWFSVLYPISRKLPRPSIKLPGDSPNKLRERLAKLKADYHLYSTVLWESFDVVWLAYQKKEAGRDGDLDELIEESLQVNYVESKDGTTITYRIQKRQPVYPDYICRHITSKTKEVEEEHFFGIDPADNKQWSAWADEYLDRFLSEPEHIFPSKTDKGRIAYLHPEPLSPELTKDELVSVCTGGYHLCLAWGAKYSPLLRKACLTLNKWKPVERKTPDLDSEYPGLYWDILESQEDEHRDALSIFFEVISVLHKCDDKSRLGGFIITTFKNLLIDRQRNEIKHRTERDMTTTLEETDSPAEVLLSDFHVDIDIDAIFPDDKVRNYVAKNLEESSTVIAKRFNLSSSRVRQIRKEVRQVLRDEIEAGHLYGIYLPGPGDDIKRALALIYRKPQYEYDDPYEEKKGKE